MATITKSIRTPKLTLRELDRCRLKAYCAQHTLPTRAQLICHTHCSHASTILPRTQALYVYTPTFAAKLNINMYLSIYIITLHVCECGYWTLNPWS